MAKPKTPKKPAGAASAPALPPVSKGAAPVKVPVVRAQLPLPQVRNATANSTLPPMSSTAGTDVIITAAIAAGAQIQVSWAIKGQEANPVFTATAQGSGSAGVQVPVPAWVIGLCIGHTVTIWYESGNDQSLRLELTVEVIDPDDMPKPAFLDLVFFQGSWWLDMAKFPDNARVQLCGWPFIAAGQRLWVEAVGNEHLSPRRFYWILENHVVTDEEARQGFCLLLEILREWLAGNEDWSSVTVHVGVTFDGARGIAPEDPSISHIPANAHEIPRSTANLRLGEPELKLLPPTLREAAYVEGKGWLVNPANTVDGANIDVTYDGMQRRDHVCVKFEGTPGLGSPVLDCQYVQDGDTKLVFPAPASAFSANFGHPVVVSYSVLRGQLWLSPKLTVQVLEPAGFSGIDVEEKTGGKLCLNNFSGHATATVAIWDYIAPGQTCWMWIAGQRQDGSLFHWNILVAEPIKPEWVSGGVNALLAREELEQLADCVVFDIHFAVHFQGLADLAGAIAFRPLQLQMVQEDLVLPAPQVLQAVGSDLTVWNGREGVTVRVEYDRMSPHHSIELCWEQAGECLVLEPKPGNLRPGYVEFDVPRKAVIHGIGKTVPIRYSVTSRCKQQTSADLELEISKPVRLPTPVVPQATPPGEQEGVLDMRNFEGDGDVTVEPWWFIVPDQRVWLRASGEKKGGGAYVFDVFAGKEVTLDEVTSGLRGTLPRLHLDNLRYGSRLSFTCTVTVDGSLNQASEVIFPALHISKVRNRILKEYEDFDTFPSEIITAGGHIDLPKMKVEFLSGPFTAGVYFYPHSVPGMFDRQALAFCIGQNLVSAPQHIRISFRRDLLKLRFAVTWVRVTLEFIFYGHDGEELGRRIVRGTDAGGPRDEWLEFAHPGEKLIAEFEVKAYDHIFIDYVEYSFTELP